MADGQAKQNEKIVMRVSFYSMATNIALSIFKVLAGFLAHSGAMVSDDRARYIPHPMFSVQLS